MADLADVLAAKEEVSLRLLRAPGRLKLLGKAPGKALKEMGQGLHAVGVGRKITEGKRTSTLCVRLYVLDKVAQAALPRGLRLPAKIDGVPTDVIERPLAVFQAPLCSVRRRQRQRRPFVAGISAAHALLTRKTTLGCFCRSTLPRERGRVYMLGCNHSFANLNATGGPAAAIIRQPSRGDGGRAIDRVGTLARFVPIAFGLSSTNRVDAAIADVAAGITVSNQICSIGAVKGIIAPKLGMIVRKHGRTTGYTEGRVVDVSMDTYVVNWGGDLLSVFINQIQTEPTLGYVAPPDEVQWDGWFTAPGDSGSVLVDKATQRAVALHMAGDFGISVANPIKDVCELLRITIP